MDDNRAALEIVPKALPFGDVATDIDMRKRVAIGNRGRFDVSRQALRLGVRSEIESTVQHSSGRQRVATATALQGSRAAGERHVLTVAPDIHAEVVILGIAENNVRRPDSPGVVVVVVAPLIAVLIFFCDRHQRIDGVFRVIVNVNEAGIDDAAGLHRSRACRSGRHRLTRAQHRFDAPIANPQPGAGQHVAGIIHRDHLTGEQHAGIVAGDGRRGFDLDHWHRRLQRATS